MLSAIELAISLLQGILSSAQVQGLAPEIIADVEAALAKLTAVHNTPVTFQQLESLRVKPQW
jgi:hypothetical protein